MLHYTRQIKCTGENKKEAHSLIQVFYHETIPRQHLTENLRTIRDTRKIHSIQNTGTPGILQKKNMSCFCSHCIHNIGECLFKDYADKWEFCSVLGHRKAELKSAKNDLHQKYYEKVAGENRQKLDAEAEAMNTSGMVL